MAKSATPSPADLEVLAAEHVLGVSGSTEREVFEQLAAREPGAAQARLRWENRFAALNDDFGDVAPPASVKKKLDARLFNTSAPATAQTGWWSAVGLWRGLTAIAAAFAIFLGINNARLDASLEATKGELSAALDSKTQTDETLTAFEAELAARGNRLSELENQLSTNATELAAVQSELEAALAAEKPVLVVSLKSGETDYRFLAVHEEGSDKVRMTLVSGAVDEARDFELWLVEPDKETVSLGVIEAGKSAIELTPEYVQILEKGGLLAVSLEQKGGSPTGVAQGPVIAVGAPNEL